MFMLRPRYRGLLHKPCALPYLADHADFLLAEDTRRIFRENALSLFPRRAVTALANAAD
jgi:hypothetical protein